MTSSSSTERSHGSELPSEAAGDWSVQNFYNQLSGTYHLTADKFSAIIGEEGPVLQRLLANMLGDSPLRVLDCACGIGTQVLGLAEYGHDLIGTDFSIEAIRRAGREAAARRTSVWWEVADMRALPFRPRTFDAVLCADNSLAHLLTRTDMLRAAEEMRRVLRPGGLVVITTRDYDRLRPDRPTGTSPYVVSMEQGRAITFQVWSWHADGEHYDLEHFRLLPDGAADWVVHRYITRLWAVSRSQLNDVLTTAGLTDLHWHEPSDSGYFQPIITARRWAEPAG